MENADEQRWTTEDRRNRWDNEYVGILNEPEIIKPSFKFYTV